eukprot:scaffold25535_cov117-Cylindrotheca_fusiformis.AAC.6
MKAWNVLWISATLNCAVEAGRSRYVPNSDFGHRELFSDNVKVIGNVYECNEGDFEIPDADQGFRNYKPDDVVKICIKPDIRSQNRGIVMRAVDRVNMVGEGSRLNQPIIEDKKEKFNTLALCIPGQIVCSFKTRLNERLFWSADGFDFVNITVTAVVSYSYPAFSTIVVCILTPCFYQVSMEYVDETFSLNGVAASGLELDMQFVVRTVAAPPGKFLGDGDNCNWWCQSPDWFKWLIIIFLLIVLCCCCVLCLTCPCVVKEMIDEDRDRKARREFVKERKLREQRESYASAAPQRTYASGGPSQSFRSAGGGPSQSFRSAGGGPSQSFRSTGSGQSFRSAGGSPQPQSRRVPRQGQPRPPNSYGGQPQYAEY